MAKSKPAAGIVTNVSIEFLGRAIRGSMPGSSVSIEY